MGKTKGYMREYRSRRRTAASVRDEIALIESSGFRSISQEIRPTGRASRGQGPEYAARRAIADRFDANSKDMANQQRTLDSTRGQVKFRNRDTMARTRLRLLRKVRGDAEAVARAPGDWLFKKELIDSIFATVPASFADRR